MAAKLPGALEAVNASAYLDQPGMPDTAPEFRSVQLDTLTALAESWPDGGRPSAHQIASWKPTELLVYLQKLPRTLTQADCAWLDEHFQLMGRGNYEILVEWLTLAATRDYEPAFPRVRRSSAGGPHEVPAPPLWRARPASAHPAPGPGDLRRRRPGYHGLSRRVVQGVLDKFPHRRLNQEPYPTRMSPPARQRLPGT